MAKNANEAIKGLIAQCDTHTKISKFTNEEFNNDLNKVHKETVRNITSVNEAINSILEVQEDVSSWE